MALINPAHTSMEISHVQGCKQRGIQSETDALQEATPATLRMR